MRTIISMLLLVVCGSVFAATNPKWAFNVEEVTVEGEPGFHWILTSKHPEHDVTLIIKLIGINNNPNQMNGWEFEYAYGPDAHHPKDMEVMEVRVNEELAKWNRNIYGRSVISKGLTSDTIEAMHDILDQGTKEDSELRELTIYYVTPETKDPDKWFWEQGPRMTFDMKDWDRVYHELIQDVRSKGGNSLLVTQKQLRNMPINKLPSNLQPKPSQMLEAAEKAGINIDAAYGLSINELEKSVRDKQRADAEAKRQAELEKKRQAEQAAQAAKEAEERARKDKMARALRNFDWPYLGCDRPSLPRAGASQSARDRFNSDKGDWAECLDNAYSKDRKAIYSLIDDIGGTWERKGGEDYYRLPIGCDCDDEISQLWDESKRRDDNRIAQWDRLQDAIDAWNDRDMSREQSREFWDGIGNALDDMDREMDRMNQQRQQQWNNQIYVSPGYY